MLNDVYRKSEIVVYELYLLIVLFIDFHCRLDLIYIFHVFLYFFFCAILIYDDKLEYDDCSSIF
jgi:hypothetical protein